MKRIPNKIKIAGIDFEISMDEEARSYLLGENRFGYCDHFNHRILIQPLASPQQFNLTFWHEILHAIDDIFLDDALSEPQVNAISQGINQVMQQIGIELTG